MKLLLRQLVSHLLFFLRRFDARKLPHHPMLPTSERKYVQDKYLKSINVLELGSGGSTLFLAANQISSTSIEIDLHFSKQLKTLIQSNSINEIIYVDIGLTSSYSEPFLWRFRNVSNEGRKYINVLESCIRKDNYDFIFIDGRWRIASALKARQLAGADCEIIIDDVFSSNFYLDDVKRIFNYEVVGRMARILSIKTKTDVEAEIKSFLSIAD